MPAALTYPGVYVEELPSGVHTITGVATSIAAFVGWAPQGPTDEATLVESFSDYTTLFGGLDSRSFLGYAVNQFFINGGQQCYIVRLESGGKPASGTVGSTLSLFAKNPGQWGNNLRITVQVQASGRFSILVQLVTASGQTQTLENFANLCVSPTTDSQYVVNVIDSDSNYITFVDPTTGNPVIPTVVPSNDKAAQLNTVTGDDGTVLVPGDGNFETALLAPNAGVNLLDRVDIFNLLCVPAETEGSTITTLQTYCAGKRAFLIVDAPQTSTVANLNSSGPTGTPAPANIIGADAANSAYYFPWVLAPDPLFKNRPSLFPPCGFVAGIYAATDTSRGVWKAPAGIGAALSGDAGLQYNITDMENGDLNPQAINCLRHFKVYGDVVWGARTLDGNDQTGSQWKYVPIRRLALYLESSLYDGTQWVVFEPNDERLWGQIRLNVGAFMQGLFLEGAFAGTTPQQAYFVKCDAENNTAASVALGVVNILVGFAPLYPAEFVVIQIQQMTGQSP